MLNLVLIPGAKLDGHRGTLTGVFIKKYNWKGIRYPSGKDDWKKFEKNNPTIALNVLYAREMEIGPARFKTQVKKNYSKKKLFF